MKNPIKRRGFLLTIVFWVLVITFVMAISYIFAPIAISIRRSLWPLFVIFSIISLLLGIILIFLTLEEKIKGCLKRFLLLTGISVIGMPVSIILHNLIYGLFIYFFGQDFWERIGLPDEPIFFIIAVLVCPIGFLVGVIGSTILFTKQGKI